MAWTGPLTDLPAHELPLLIAELDRDRGRITRVTVDPRHWRPRRSAGSLEGRARTRRSVRAGASCGGRSPTRSRGSAGSTGAVGAGRADGRYRSSVGLAPEAARRVGLCPAERRRPSGGVVRCGQGGVP
ncbi:DUF5994 family protein [Streptacidiphilus pinicola]|uniref:DUF5994 family protein n=1 Tax=Streptacidiphilus pinicola TaxID=2219663 RepID=UPI003C767FC9